ncbi:MAG: hypothetical protein HYU29_06965 [Chloroflexi bacterium]|nr:hypothetical protein [Chloroflexota bacterium]
MGLLRPLFGQRKAPFGGLAALARAETALREKLRLVSDRKGGLSYKPLQTAFFDGLQGEVDRRLRAGRFTVWTRFSLEKDSYGFGWVLLDDRSLENVVEAVQTLGSYFAEGNHTKQLLAAVFPFQGRERQAYWIYSFKRDRFYPFVPLPDEKRDSPEELRLAEAMEKELPLESALERWYPLWGMPLETRS